MNRIVDRNPRSCYLNREGDLVVKLHVICTVCKDAQSGYDISFCDECHSLICKQCAKGVHSGEIPYLLFLRESLEKDMSGMLIRCYTFKKITVCPFCIQKL